MTDIESLRSKAKILVVDDSDFARKTIATQLENSGYNVVGEAANSRQAFEVTSTQKPHIALIDIVMPDVNGIELAKSLIDNYDGVIIVMMSSLAQEHVVIEAISSGASDFLQKPISKESLESTLDRIIKSLNLEEKS